MAVNGYNKFFKRSSYASNKRQKNSDLILNNVNKDMIFISV